VAQVLGRRELGRALLARQMPLERADATVEEAVNQLVGMQAQAPYTVYFGLWSRQRKFGTADLADALTERRLVRSALMRSTIHLVTTADYRSLRPWAQPALDPELDTAFKTTLTGLDRAAVAASGRALLYARHLTPKELGAELRERWPDHEPHALATVVRNLVPLVQVPPRAVWGIGRHNPVRDGSRLDRGRARRRRLRTHRAALPRRLGPASVTDVQTCAGRTRLRPVIEGLRPQLAVFHDEHGVEAAGLLMYAAAVAQRRGVTVHWHWWSRQPSGPFEPGIEGWVCDGVGRLLDGVGGRPLLIGKSLGTNAATLAAERC